MLAHDINPMPVRAIMKDLLTHFLRTVHREHFLSFPLWRMDDGRIVGEYFKVRLESHFLPVADEQARIFGQAAELRAFGPNGASIGEQALRRLTQVSELPVVLDRFIRCLHVLNHLRSRDNEETLLLPVSTALLERVDHNHGLVFRQILERLRLPPEAVGFLLPAALAREQTLLARLNRSYIQNGFSAYLPLGAHAGVLQVRPLQAQLDRVAVMA
jgi:EAL domain-containing protein (putative c-di-GMP-specific phosphodiesterase class I)